MEFYRATLIEANQNENIEVYLCSRFLLHSNSQDVSKMQQFNFRNKFEVQIAGKYFV